MLTTENKRYELDRLVASGSLYGTTQQEIFENSDGHEIRVVYEGDGKSFIDEINSFVQQEG